MIDKTRAWPNDTRLSSVSASLIWGIVAGVVGLSQHLAPAAASDAAMVSDVRPLINDVAKDILQQYSTKYPGLQILKTGSHVSGRNYRNPLWPRLEESIKDVSDHDFELIAPLMSKSDTEALYKVMHAEFEDRLTKRLSGSLQNADDVAAVLKSVNFYPPQQLVEAVETQAEAVDLFTSLGVKPNMGGGQVEGTWGPGAFVENANYAARSGKIMTINENGEVVEVLADLAKRAESGAVGGKFTAAGCASMTGQWVEHGAESLEKSQARSLLKYLQRSSNDYKKGCALAQVGSGQGAAELDSAVGKVAGIIDEATPQARSVLNYDATLADLDAAENLNKSLFRQAKAAGDVGAKGRAVAALEQIANKKALLNARLEAEIQKISGPQLKVLAAEIEGVLTRTAARSAVLTRLAKAGNPGERAILANILNPTTGKWKALADAFWEHLPAGGNLAEYAAEWGMVGVTLYQITTGTQAEAMSAAAYEAIFRLGGWRAGIAGLATDLFLQMARDGLWGMAGRSQDALLLLNGIYTVWGGQNVRESPWNMDARDLWKTFPDNSQGMEDLEVRVRYHAHQAALTKLGTATDRADLEASIVQQCLPLVKEEWRRQRTRELDKVNRLFTDAMGRVAAGGTTLVVREVRDPAVPVIVVPKGKEGMPPVTEVTLDLGFTYRLPDVFGKLRQIREILNALECDPGRNAFYYSIRLPLEMTGAGKVEKKIGPWTNGASQETTEGVPAGYRVGARLTGDGWYTARLAADAAFSILTVPANSRDITDGKYCILPPGPVTIPLAAETDVELKVEGEPPAVPAATANPPVGPEKKAADRPAVEAKEPQKKAEAVPSPGAGPKAVAGAEDPVPAGPVEVQGTFSDSFSVGSGGGPISLTFSDRMTRMKGSCDYKSSENVTGGNRPGRYEFAGGKYPRLFIADGRFTGSIAWIKHYVLFPSAVSNNSFDVEGTIDLQAGTITGHATREPDYHWTVTFPPILRGPGQTTEKVKTLPTTSPEQQPRLSETPLFGRNLVTNGGGEADKASPDGRDVVTISGWKVDGKVTLACYDSPNPDYAGIHPGSPVPPNAGANFFTGGPDNPTSSVTQTVDLASTSDAIDSGKATFCLAGYLGGYAADNDNATVTAVFSNGQGAVIGEARIGPVLSKDRGGKDGLLLRETTGAMPPGARSVVLTLTMTRASGRYNDGYADEISFALSKP